MCLVKIVLGFDRQILLVVFVLFSNHDFCLIAVSLGRFSSRPRARHARTGCKRAGWRFAAAQTGADLEIPPPTACSLPFSSMVPRCCPIGPCRRKYDLSRAGVGSVPGTPAGVGNDLLEPPGPAGIAGWLAAAVPAALSFGRCPRSSDAPGSRNCRCKTPTRSPASGKSTAVTPLFWSSHPSRAWTTALSWNSGCAVVVPSKRGRHKENPDR